MEGFLTHPHLPKGKVTGIFIGEGHTAVEAALKKQGIHVYIARGIDTLDAPIQRHIDLQLVHLGGNRFYTGNTSVKPQLEKLGGEVLFHTKPHSPYPNDCSYNFLLIDRFILKGKRTPILPEAITEGYSVMEAAQGYVKCSVAVVSKKSIITSDISIAEKCKMIGIEVLLVSTEGISLKGYPCGFIGGCSCLVDPNRLAFFGSLENHPQSVQIQTFCQKQGVECVSLLEGALQDIGSAVPIKEELW